MRKALLKVAAAVLVIIVFISALGVAVAQEEKYSGYGVECNECEHRYCL